MIEISPNIALHNGNGRDGDRRLPLPVNSSYSLDYLPITYSLGGKPRTVLQYKVLEGLQERLHNPEFRGEIFEIPHKDTPADQRPRMVMVFGNGELLSSTNSLELHRHSPKPAPLFFMVNTVPHLPSIVEHDMARSQIVEGAAHCGVVFAGQSYPERALWISTQGNFQVIEGTPDEIYKDVALRMQIHFGSPFVKKRRDGELMLLWKRIAQSQMHKDIAEAAHLLGEAGIIENEVDLHRYTPNKILARMLGKAFNANGIGESMRSEIDPDGYMGVTRSGGGKVKVDDNPKKGHIVPVWAITPDGYLIPTITRKPLMLKLFTYANGSVETHENGVIRLINSAARDGQVSNTEEALAWIQTRFTQDPFIPIQPKDLPPTSIVTIDHGHKYAKRARAKNVLIGEPDFQYFPKLDFACGSRPAAWALLSGLMKFDEFKRPEGLKGTIIFINLPGHGYVAVGENRQAVTEALINGVELGEPERV